MKSSQRPLHLSAALLVVVTLFGASCTTNSDDDAATPTTVSGDDQSSTATDASSGAAGSDTTDSASTDGSSTDGTPSEGAPLELTASWTGVTEDSIKIGYIAIDNVALKEQFDFDLDVGPNTEIIQAQIDVTNANGGINGRTVELIPEKFLPVGADDSTRACEVLTAEEQVFLVIGNLINDNMLCVTELHETPYLGMFGLTDERQERSRAPFVALEMAADKQRVNSIKVLLAEGDLEGKRVAVDYGVAESAIADIVLPMLEDAGIDVVAATERQDFGTDTAANEQEMDTAVQKWVAADTQILIPLGGVVPPSLGIQRNNYEPERVIFLNGQARNTDLFEGTGVEVDRFTFASAVVPSRQSVEEFLADPTVVACLDNYYAANPDVEPFTAETAEATYEGMGRACSAWELFRLAAEAAGGDLTPDTWVAAVEAIGPIDLPGQPGLTFEPGKRDGGNEMARYAFDASLGHLVPDGDPIPVE